MEPLISKCAAPSALHRSRNDGGDAASQEAPPYFRPPTFPSSSFYGDAPFRLSDLLAAELERLPLHGYLARLRDGSLDPGARRDAVHWLHRARAIHCFRPTTGFLAVDYLDGFLSSQMLPKGLRWPWQLLSVACLSVAAKMEETEPPSLLDLQVMEPQFVFEPRTVQRMELRLMSTLRWRVRSVTPFDFLDCFISLLPLGGLRPSSLSLASDLILGTREVVDFLECRASAIAAAAVLCVAGDGGDDLARFYDAIDQEALGRCRRLMEEYLRSLPPEAPPRSPAGVLDAAVCGRCGSQQSAAAAAATPDGDPAERRRRRRRLSAVPHRQQRSSSFSREDR